MGLIVKCKTMTSSTNKTQKPAFRWIGSVDSSYLDPEKVAEQVRELNLLDDVKPDESDARYRNEDNIIDDPPTIVKSFSYSSQNHNIKTKKTASSVVVPTPVIPTMPRMSINDSSIASIRSTLPYISSNVRIFYIFTLVVCITTHPKNKTQVQGGTGQVDAVKAQNLTQKHAQLLRQAVEASQRATQSNRSFQWNNNVSDPPEPHEMLRFQQLHLQKFMQEYCAHWHQWKNHQRTHGMDILTTSLSQKKRALEVDTKTGSSTSLSSEEKSKKAKVSIGVGVGLGRGVHV